MLEFPVEHQVLMDPTGDLRAESCRTDRIGPPRVADEVGLVEPARLMNTLSRTFDSLVLSMLHDAYAARCENGTPKAPADTLVFSGALRQLSEVRKIGPQAAV
jgi:hypothetical protein